MSPGGVPDRLDVNIIRKSYASPSGEMLDVLRDLTFTLAVGEVGAIVGPSGAGKTTLLRLITGLDRKFEGSIRLPAHGKLGMVFQEPRLLPWRSVEQNVRLGAPKATDAELDALFETLGLSAHRGLFPGQLSGGLARRVAIARAFAVNPDLLVLDEPFVSLDAALAAHLRDELALLVTHRRVTTLLVTHDIDEAIRLADRIFVLSARPARIVGQVPIERPRLLHPPQEVEAARAAIERYRAQRVDSD